MSLPLIIKDIEDRLKLSGGKIDGNLFLNGSVSKYSSGDQNYIHFLKGSVSQGYLGVNGENNPVFISADATTIYDLYGEHNKPTAADVGALSLNGGTLNKGKSINFYSANTGGCAVGCDFLDKNGNKIAGIGVLTGDGAFTRVYLGMSNSPWLPENGLAFDSNNITWKNKKLYGEHNKPTPADIGAPTTTGSGASGTWPISISGSAAKASQDGNGNSIYNNYEKRYAVTVDLTSLNQNTWYPVITDIPKGGLRRIACVCQLDRLATPSWSNHDRGFTAVLEFLTLSGGWGITGAQTICLVNDQKWLADGAAYPVGYTQYTNSSNACFYCRGGGKYILETDWFCSWRIITSSQTISSQEIAPKTTYPDIVINKSTIRTDIMGDVYVPTNTDYTTQKARNIAANTSLSTPANGNVFLVYT